MLYIVDMSEQFNHEGAFAVWDTVIDRFLIDIHGGEAWESLEDLCEAGVVSPKYMDRVLKLLESRNKPTDDAEECTHRCHDNPALIMPCPECGEG